MQLVLSLLGLRVGPDHGPNPMFVSGVERCDLMIRRIHLGHIENTKLGYSRLFDAHNLNMPIESSLSAFV